MTDRCFLMESCPSWSKEHDWKSCNESTLIRGFESLALRHNIFVDKPLIIKGLSTFLLPLGLTKPLVEPGVDKKALANKTSMLQSRWFGNRIRKEQGGFTQVKNEVKHTAHSSYRCEYHLVFAPKYRRKVIYKAVRRDIIEIIKKLCKEMKVEIIEGEACPDHIHLLVSIPPYMSIAQFVGTLKSKSALMIFDRHANLKYKYGSRNFWCRGYFVDTVGKNAKMIQEYIKNQLEEDLANDQISLKEYMDPFTGSKRK